MDILKLAVELKLADGENPNEIIKEVETTIEANGRWELWGDGRWRLDTVCSICGSGVPGICGHQEDPSRKIIMRSEYQSQQD